MTTKNNIEQIVINAKKTLKNRVDIPKHKDYLFSLLFLKYISDVYDEYKEDLIEKYGSNTEVINLFIEKAEYNVPEKSRFKYLYENRRNPKIGEMINIAKNNLENENKKLVGIFQGIDFNSNDLGNNNDKIAILSKLLEDFSKLDLRKKSLENESSIGDAFIDLLPKFSNNNKIPDFFTPIEVSEILASIVLPKDGETIYDPTCGSGSLLIKTLNKAKNINKVQIYGQEINFRTWSICRMNMFFHNIKDAKIYHGDTISDPQTVEFDGTTLKKFDCIVANPPFKVDNLWKVFDASKSTSQNFKLSNSTDPFSRFEWGVPPKDKFSYAFVLHMIASLEENGRMAVVLPQGVLFRKADELLIRKQIIKHNYLDAVMILSDKLISSGNVCILVIKKNKETKDVLFIDASNYLETKKKNTNFSKDSISHIVDMYENRKKVDGLCNIVSLEKIIENDYDFSVSKYVELFVDDKKQEEEINIDDVIKEFNTLEAKRDKITKEVYESLKELGLL